MTFNLEATLNHENTPPLTQGSGSTFKCIDNLSTDSSLANSTVSSKYQGRRYTGKLSISDIPELVELCSQFLKSQNVTGLAMLARQAGLPPHLRCKIWPILLRTHPFVQSPYIEIDLDEDNEDEVNYNIPVKDIKFDLRKYLRSSEKYIPKVLTSELKELFEIQNKIFDTIEYAIIKFLKKWNKIIHYNSSLAWIALGLAEWVPALPNSNYVLCGRDDIAKNGTKLRDINDSSFERLSKNISSNKSSCSEYSSDTSLSTTDNISLSSISTRTSDISTEGRQMTFSEMYERLVLVILHSPEQPENEEDERNLEGDNNNGHSEGENENGDDDLTNFKQYSVLAKKGGLIKDRISFFLFCLRKLMPELYNYLGEEDCLNGDWILWWLKYCGSKVWSRYDRGRTWDLVLGYRTKCEKEDVNLKELENLSIEQKNLLGQDIFWNPLDNINEVNEQNSVEDNVVDTIIEDEEIGIEIERDFKHDRSMSVLTLKNKQNEQTPILSSVELSNELIDLNLNNEIDIPFSMIHPHVEIIFIGLAFLKSKEFTIMELDHAEIKTLFSKLSSLKTDFGEMNSFVGTRDENDNFKSLENNHNENLIDNKRKSNRDIENIVIEAGELWRKFLYINMIEE
ncbi:hypothetical protein CANINC_004407 [Pichia inconspicua]|uniref:Rab-GAP TBC domain-containing protein n=1 Tax=Pichia inconspicua TaxID=52247 RepID=A0A4T0WW80_9ASCO|nr:hypothetical protein CANINC_004407 [[Candida] inconspicua]